MSEVKPIYLYRRKGQPAWATCDAERYDELRGQLGDRLFDTGTAYSASDYDALAAECERLRKMIDVANSFQDALESQRDAALAELAALKPFCEYCGGNDEFPQDHCMDCTRPAGDVAALKGGQKAVAWVLFRDGEVCYETDDNIVISNTPGDESDRDKWLPVFTAPPARASAWVPVSESLPADRRDVMLYCADTKEHFVGFSKGGGLFQFAQDGNGLSIVCRPSHWRYIEDSEAPTPGASDGKGGDV